MESMNNQVNEDSVRFEELLPNQAPMNIEIEYRREAEVNNSEQPLDPLDYEEEKSSIITTWHIENQFDNRDKAKEELKLAGFKTIPGSYVYTLNKTSVSYKCSFGCGAKRRLILYNDLAVVETNGVLHMNSCEEQVNRTRSLVNLLSSNATTKSIIQTLGFPDNKKTRENIKNRKYYTRKKVQKKYEISNEYDLIVWCNKNSITSLSEIPSNPIKPFVVDYIVEKQFYSILMSTYTLCEDYITYCNMYDQIPQLIQVDGTYRLVKNNYVLLVLGCQDAAGVFHCIGMCLSSNENSRAYSFMLNGMKELLAGLNFDFNPHYSMSDGAKAIENAIVEVLGRDTVRLMCRFHAKFNIQKKIGAKYFPEIRKEERKDTYKKVNSDIKMLESCSKKDIFEKAWILIKKRWEDIGCLTFLEYFKKTWMEEHPGWSNCFRQTGIPSSNNAVEGFNNYLKIANHREKKEIGDFLENSMTTLKEKSLSTRPLYSIHRKISPRIWKYVKALSSVGSDLFVKERGTYYICDTFTNLTFLDKKKNVLINVKHFDKLFNLNKENLEELFKETLYAKPTQDVVRIYKTPSLMEEIKECYEVVGLRKLEVNLEEGEEDAYFGAVCSCPDHYDVGYCLHSLALLVLLRLVEIPNELINKSINFILINNYFRPKRTSSKKFGSTKV